MHCILHCPVLNTLLNLPLGSLLYQWPLQVSYRGATSSTSASVAAAVEQVNNTPSEKHGTSKGAISTAGLVPISLLAAAYIFLCRQKYKFSKMVDNLKRTSMILTDRKSLSGAGTKLPSVTAWPSPETVRLRFRSVPSVPR